ncbi:hypothetical protein H8E77_30210 [bacterium]|nr:hypothetical protein [bacterium]
MIDRNDIVINRSTLGKSIGVRARATVVGDIYAPDVSGFPDESAQSFDESNGLIFRDGSFLRFLERVQVGRRIGARVLAYSYHYQRPGEDFFIRFDFEELPTSNPIRKPQYHVHTSAKPEFHIPSISIDLNLVLNLIQVNFFAS